MKTTALFLLSLVCITASNTYAKQFKALVFADSFDTWHHPNVPVARESFKRLSEKHFFELKFVDTDKSFGVETFADYDVIVFISANPCELNEEKRKEFQDYVQNGGAIVGVHSACATRNEPKRWPWWEDLMGRVFVHHPVIQTGILSVVEKDFPACLHLPEKWLWSDEWYEFGTPFPEHLNVVLTVDETTYQTQEGHGMGDYHPIAWYHEFEGARIFYTAIGHISESYRDADFLQHIYGGMAWAVDQQQADER